MYLVLTAMLALNVSAEVMQAFFRMDEGLKESSMLVNRSNLSLGAAINKQAEAYSQYEPFRAKSKEVQAITDEFYREVGTLKELLLTESGGNDEHGKPLHAKDTDTPTRLLVNEGRGDVLENSVNAIRKRLLAQVEDEMVRATLAETIPLKVNPVPADSEKNSWTEFNFQQMPMAAVLPILTKLQNDVRMSETAILNHFLNQMNGDIFVTDQYATVVAAEKNYVIRGEPFRSEIFLSAYSSTADNIEITVDGRRLAVEGGKAIFNATPSSVGDKKHHALVKMTNPVTGEIKTFEKTFEYEVGERSVTVSADKMQVMYIGVDNPISISAAGVSSDQVQVNAQGVNLRKESNGHFIAKPTRPGKATITVSGGGLKPTTFEYKVKKIPNPVITLGGKLGGQMNVAEFKVHRGIIPILENFDFQAKCTVDGFEVTRVRNGDAVSEMNKDGTYKSGAKRLVNNAKRKDKFYFDKIKVRCPGDVAGRTMNGLIFTLK
ncbi:MAG: gliding motility-associated protein GldM [Saprospiraceae bacterium]|jgi:gliding motility-associated protein GldM